MFKIDSSSKVLVRQLIRGAYSDFTAIVFLATISTCPFIVTNFAMCKRVILALCRAYYPHVTSTLQVVTITIALVVALFPLNVGSNVVKLDRSLDLLKDLMTTLRDVDHFTSVPVSFITKEAITIALEENRGPSLFLRQVLNNREIRLDLEKCFDVRSSRTLETNDLILLRPFRDHPHGGSGWDNTGNTCFVAACVNAIFLTSPLVSILTKTFQVGVSASGCRTENSSVFLTFNMGGLVSRRFWNPDNALASAVYVSTVKPIEDVSVQFLWFILKCLTSAHLSDRRSLNLSAISTLSPFGIGSQEDVFEFLQWMLNRFASIELGEKIHDATANPTAALCDRLNGATDAISQSRVLGLFTSRQTSRLVCHSCNRSSFITETLNALLLPIDHHTSGFSTVPSRATLDPPCQRLSPPAPTLSARPSPPLDSASTTSSCNLTDCQKRRIFVLSDLTRARARGARDLLKSQQQSTTPSAVAPSQSSDGPITRPPDNERPPSVVSSVYDLGSETSSVTTRESLLSEVSTDDQVALSSRADSYNSDTPIDLGGSLLETCGVDPDETCALTQSSELGDSTDRFFAVSTLHRNSAYSAEGWLTGTPDTLADLFNRYLSYEYLADYTCDPSEGCGMLGHSGKQAHFERLPPILILVLNRFRHIGQSAKICLPVIINRFLAIPVFTPVGLLDCDDHAAFFQVNYEIYEFYATIIHSGESLHSGHYTVFGRPVGFVSSTGTNSEDQHMLWFVFDDKSVNPADFSYLERMTMNVVDTPYVVFFKHLRSERVYADGTESPQLIKRRTVSKLGQPGDQQLVLGADTLEALIEKLEGVNGDKGTRASSEEEQDLDLPLQRNATLSPPRSEAARPSISSSMSVLDRPTTCLPSSPDTLRPSSPLSQRRRRSNEPSPSGVDCLVSDSSNMERRDPFHRALRLENICQSSLEPIFPLQLILETLIDNIMLQLT
eukprot:Blabericola_migrator_1__315@NODE_1080_length_5498_cov_189_077702_g570_i1_p1_GENE_NODE_1080_length_5498_cov_189_077702_g570_i1NODE_1080_length_5498_cov_189_077702_g570_i1_p1_ORF_typecomplete_len954_score169_26UCH/PF00443_29/4_6e33UCH_1/PF13423_6/0_0021_NODE_1080_length_5498_cov_189_077702_g570_i118784739